MRPKLIIAERSAAGFSLSDANLVLVEHRQRAVDRLLDVPSPAKARSASAAREHRARIKSRTSQLMGDVGIERLRHTAGLLALGVALFDRHRQQRAQHGVVRDVLALLFMRAGRIVHGARSAFAASSMESSSARTSGFRRLAMRLSLPRATDAKERCRVPDRYHFVVA